MNSGELFSLENIYKIFCTKLFTKFFTEN